MGFLNRLRRGAVYGPTPDADAAQVRASPVDRADTPPDGGPDEPPVGAAELHPAPVRGPDALFTLGRRAQGDRTTAAERAFMDLKRGSND